MGFHLWKSNSQRLPAADDRSPVPLVASDEQKLLASRPPAWEHRLFAGVLVQEELKLEPRWRAHQDAADELSDGQVLRLIPAAIDDVTSCLSKITQALDPAARSATFGSPGTPGNPELIREAAKQIASGYEDLLDWAARIRSMRSTKEGARVLDVLAHLVDRPIENIREFVNRLVGEISDLPRRNQEAHGQHIEIRVELILEADPRVAASLERATQRLVASRKAP